MPSRNRMARTPITIPAIAPPLSFDPDGISKGVVVDAGPDIVDELLGPEPGVVVAACPLA